MSLRDIILKFMPPKMRAAAEADSRKWVATCPRCQKLNSIWDIGGIRYRAAGVKSSLARCAHCGKTNFMRFEKRL
jgi:phage FluMu protein Com